MEEPSKSNGVAVWDRVRTAFRRSGDYRPPEDDRQGSRGPVIAICVLVSGLLWFAFSMQENYPLTLDLETEVRNLDPSRTLKVLPPSTVRVQVVGQGVSLFQLYYNRPAVSVDASLQEVNFEAVDLNLPKDVRLESVTPRLYIPETEARNSKKVPVLVRAHIAVPPSHDFIELLSVSPDSVVVTAGQSVLDSLFFWPTKVFAEDNLRDTLDVQVALGDTLADVTSLNVDAVTLSAVAMEFTGGTREIEVEVVGAPSDKKLVTLDPSTVEVRYRVMLSQFNDAVESPDFFATVQYGDIRSDTTGNVRPYIHIPQDIELRDVEVFPLMLHYYNYLSDD